MSFQNNLGQISFSTTHLKTNMTLSVWENKPLRHLWEFSVPSQWPIQYPTAAYFCYFWEGVGWKPKFKKNTKNLTTGEKFLLDSNR